MKFLVLMLYKPTTRIVTKKLWLLNLPTKIKVTVWRISWNYLPTRVNMQHRKLVSNTSCPRCGESNETTDHIFRECPVTMEWITWISDQFTTCQNKLFWCGLWAIWGERNKECMSRNIVQVKK
ncbi:RNA-directed DNA polymerase (Reverse transcriptase) [Gossypium australe]|uniref:RNA-directed DNA polymerase (Reverse transcriptase) n=1 Tax=Gossypium australe TaxID=47621 RepID=A0A5B6WPU4_9ROSI|nr:RNA-directed DNA polymerase (Reverse transcriptase) [Gossypium australe]